jgi:hypothetical protein
MDLDEKTGKMRVKAFITTDEKTVPVGDKSEEKASTPKATRRTH